jgi:electron transfer flavoprotein alpha subunit
MVDDQKFEKLQTEPYLSALTKLAADYRPEIILMGSTKRGKELAARLTTRLETGMVSDAFKLEIDENKRLMATRIVYGGNGLAKETYRTKPQIATVPPRTFEKPKPTERTGQVVQVNIKLEEPKTEIVEIKPVAVEKVRIEEAKIIVSGGRGVEKKEDFKILEDLAKLLGGQVGNTRPLAEDRKWFSEWVGLSGKKVKPNLYVACGLSGVIQHVAGMRDSKVVVAINKDPEAPIFQVADYIVVGDIYQVIPALTGALRKVLKS